MNDIMDDAYLVVLVQFACMTCDEVPHGTACEFESRILGDLSLFLILVLDVCCC